MATWLPLRLKEEFRLNEVAYIILGEKDDQRRLKAEVIRVRGELAQLQVFELTKGLGIGAHVEFTGELLAVELGPGLLTQIYDGLPESSAGTGRKSWVFSRTWCVFGPSTS